MLLTAYNEDVQNYIKGATLDQTKKTEYLMDLEKKVIESGNSFAKLFAGKKYRVLDEIIYLLSGKGIWKVGAQTLADRCECSLSVIHKTVRAIKDTNEILVCRIANNRAGKYIFVLKSHPNFKEILKEVFYIDELPGDDNKTSLETSQNTSLENAESLVAVSVEGEKSGSNNNNYNNNILKQEKYIIKDSIENDLKSVSKDEKKELERVHNYYTNDYQFDLYREFKKSTYHEKIRNSISILGLRLGSNCTKERYIAATKVLFKINSSLNNDLLINKSVPALFDMMIEIELNKPKQQPKIEKPFKPMPFYNWLQS